MNPTGEPALPRIGIVGPCTAGKSTLIANLKGQFDAIELRHIAQEHSYVPTMWQKISHPKWLIFLDVSYPVTIQRNSRLNWTEEEYLEQQRRLKDARANADFYLDTDELSPQQVAEKVQSFLQALGIPLTGKAD